MVLRPTWLPTTESNLLSSSSWAFVAFWEFLRSLQLFTSQKITGRSNFSTGDPCSHDALTLAIIFMIGTFIQPAITYVYNMQRQSSFAFSAFYLIRSKSPEPLPLQPQASEPRMDHHFKYVEGIAWEGICWSENTCNPLRTDTNPTMISRCAAIRSRSALVIMVFSVRGRKITTAGVISSCCYPKGPISSKYLT